MAENEYTTKFNVDVSDLKSGITEANQAIKLANSEFKAASTALGDWENSTDGIKAKLTQLSSVLDAQKAKLQAYKDQQTAMDNASAENGRRADELRAKLAELAANGVSKTSTEYKKYESALASCEKEQVKNQSASDALKITINNQQAAVNATTNDISKYNTKLGELASSSNDAERETDDLSKSIKDADKNAGEAASGGFSVLKGALSELVASGIKAAASGLVKLGKAAINMGKQAVASYGEYEQLVGGIETIFGTGGQSIEEYAKSVGKSVDSVKGEYLKLESAQSSMLTNAQNAYKTAGLSANDYLNTATSFSASLLQGLNGDTVAAAKVTDMAITDMADNANKMGTDISSIQNAYQGFAKQNYTMLDNLKLGYGGNQTEMARLINDSGVLGDSVEITAKTVKNVPFDKIAEAIHVVQQRTGMTGTTAKEAASTIQGSVGSMKASWQNLLTGMADPTQNVSELVGQLVASVGTVLQNVLPRVSDVISAIFTMVQSLLPEIPPLIQQLMPVLIQSLQAVLQGITTVLPSIITAIVNFLPEILKTILDMLPQLATTVITIITDIISQIGNMLPKIVAEIIKIVPQLVSALLDNIPTLFYAAVQFLMAIVQALPEMINELVTALPTIISTVIEFLMKCLPQLMSAAIQLFDAIVTAIPQFLPQLIAALPKIIITIVTAVGKMIPQLLLAATQLFYQIVTAVPKILSSLIVALKNLFTSAFDGIKEKFNDAANVGLNIVKGIWEGIKNAKDWIVGKVKSFASGILDGMKNALGIHSPSTVFRDQVGKQVAAGIAVGIERNSGTAITALKNLSKSMLIAAKDTVNDYKETGKDISSKLGKSIDANAKNSIQSVKNLVNGQVSSYSTTISKKVDELKNNLSKTTAGLNNNFEAQTKRLKAQLDKDIALIKANDSLSTDTKNSRINALKTQVNAEIDTLKNANTTKINTLKTQVNDEIKVLNDSKSLYKKAGENAIKAYTDAMNDYTGKAKEIVTNIVTDISEEFNTQYKELEKKQENLYSKMTGIGTLYTTDMFGEMILSDLRTQTQAITDYADNLNGIKGKISDTLFSEIADMSVEDGNKYIKLLENMTSDELAEYDKLYNAKLNTSIALSGKVYKKDGENLKNSFTSAIDSALDGTAAQLNELGKQAMTGFINGMSTQAKDMASDIKKITNNIVNQIKKDLKIHSPSKVFEKLGIYSGEGYKVGFVGSLNKAKRAISSALPTDIKNAVNSQNTTPQGATGSAVYNFYQTNNSPKSLSRLDIYRATKNQLAMAKGV